MRNIKKIMFLLLLFIIMIVPLKAKEKSAYLVGGIEFNTKLLNFSEIDCNPEGCEILLTKFEKANTLPNNIDEKHLVSTSTSPYPVYIWYENKIMYYYSEANVIYLNENSDEMFANFEKLTEIDLSDFDTSKVTSFNKFFYKDILLEKIIVRSENDKNNFMKNYNYHNYVVNEQANKKEIPLILIICSVCGLIVICVIVILILKKKKKNNSDIIVIKDENTSVQN